jgi:hypothetical protein
VKICSRRLFLLQTHFTWLINNFSIIYYLNITQNLHTFNFHTSNFNFGEIFFLNFLSIQPLAGGSNGAKAKVVLAKDLFERPFAPHTPIEGAFGFRLAMGALGKK